MYTRLTPPPPHTHAKTHIPNLPHRPSLSHLAVHPAARGVLVRLAIRRGRPRAAEPLRRPRDRLHLLVAVREGDPPPIVVSRDGGPRDPVEVPLGSLQDISMIGEFKLDKLNDVMSEYLALNDEHFHIELLKVVGLGK